MGSQVDVVLHGHTHETSGWAATRSGASLVVLGAGAAYAGSQWRHGVQADRRHKDRI